MLPLARGHCFHRSRGAASERQASTGMLLQRLVAGVIASWLPLLAILLAFGERPAQASVPPTATARDGEAPAVWLVSDGVADDQTPATCDVSTALRTGTITLDETGVGAPCIVVGAGDLVTWVNLTAAGVVIQTASDEFATADVSAVFSTVEVPAQGQAAVRVLHAGRIDYTVPDRPAMSGTILVLGRGAA